MGPEVSRDFCDENRYNILPVSARLLERLKKLWSKFFMCSLMGVQGNMLLKCNVGRIFECFFFSKCWLCTWLLTVFSWLSCLFTFLNIAQILYINRQSCFLTFYLSRLQAAADCLMLALTTMSTCLLCFVLFRKLLVEWVWTPRRPRRCGKTKRLLKSTLPCFTVIRYHITTCWRKTERSPNYSQIVWKIKAQICWVNTKNKSLYQTENRKWMKHFTEILCLLFAYFQKAGVTISDHHSASESFMKHMENEVSILCNFNHRRPCLLSWPVCCHTGIMSWLK